MMAACLITQQTGRLSCESSCPYGTLFGLFPSFSLLLVSDEFSATTFPYSILSSSAAATTAQLI